MNILNDPNLSLNVRERLLGQLADQPQKKSERQAAQEAAKKKAEEEATKKQKEEEVAKKKAEEEATKKQKEEEVAKKKAEEEAANKKELPDAKQKEADAAKIKSNLEEAIEDFRPSISNIANEFKGFPNPFKGMADAISSGLNRPIMSGGKADRVLAAIRGTTEKFGGVLPDQAFKSLPTDQQVMMAKSGHRMINPAEQAKLDALVVAYDAAAKANAKTKSTWDRAKEVGSNLGGVLGGAFKGGAGLAAFEAANQLGKTLVGGEKFDLGRSVDAIGKAGLLGAGQAAAVRTLALMNMPRLAGAVIPGVVAGLESLQDTENLNTLYNAYQKETSPTMAALESLAAHGNPSYYLSRLGAPSGSLTNMGLSTAIRGGLYYTNPATLAASLAGITGNMVMDPFVRRLNARGTTEYDVPPTLGAHRETPQEELGRYDSYLKNLINYDVEHKVNKGDAIRNAYEFMTADVPQYLDTDNGQIDIAPRADPNVIHRRLMQMPGMNPGDVKNALSSTREFGSGPVIPEIEKHGVWTGVGNLLDTIEGVGSYVSDPISKYGVLPAISAGEYLAGAAGDVASYTAEGLRKLITGK